MQRLKNVEYLVAFRCYFRWKLIANEMTLKEDSSLSFTSHFLYPLTLYMIWQVGYLFVTGMLLTK